MWVVEGSGGSHCRVPTTQLPPTKHDLSSVTRCKSALPLSHISAASADQCATGHCHAKTDSPGASGAVGAAHWAPRRIRHLPLTPGVPSISRSGAAADRGVAQRSFCVPVGHLPLLPRPHRSHLLCSCQRAPVQQLGVVGEWGRPGGTLPPRVFNKAAVCV